jgi:hypothetical protein
MIGYMLTNGKGYYISKDKFNGKFVSIGNKRWGCKWIEYNRIENVLRNSLSKNLRDNFYIIEVEMNNDELKDTVDYFVSGKEDSNKDKHISNNKESAYKNLDIDKIKQDISMPIKTDELDKIKEDVSLFSDTLKDLRKRKQELLDLQSEVDKEISDIYHYIELSNLNAYQGWLMYKMLQYRLKRRRVIKDELSIIKHLVKCNIDTQSLSEIQDMIKNMDNRKYTPRILSDLFK